MDNQSIVHTRWNCTYHIVFISKYRRKIMYGETKKDLVEIIKKLCEMKQASLIDERFGVYVIFERDEYPDAIRQASRVSEKWGDRLFWARGYYISTVWNINEKTILKYIQEQEENDKLEDGRK